MNRTGVARCHDATGMVAIKRLKGTSPFEPSQVWVRYQTALARQAVLLQFGGALLQ